MSETSPREHDDVVASEALFRLLAENASDIVARLNIDGTIEWVSPSVSRRLLTFTKVEFMKLRAGGEIMASG